MPMCAKGLAKLIEECGELTQIAGKKLAYFHTDVHPDGAGSLARRLEDEIGDVIAACTFVEKAFGLSTSRIIDRTVAKRKVFESWDALTDNNQHAVDRK